MDRESNGGSDRVRAANGTKTGTWRETDTGIGTGERKREKRKIMR